MKTKLTLFLSLLIISIQLIAQEQVIKILAIGNSFSEDAIENYLYDLAKATNKKVIIGNMYIGGASVELHVNNSKENKASYNYRKVDEKGIKTKTNNVSIANAIQDEDWDYISLQQASPFSGQYEVTIKDLPALISYVKSIKLPKSKLIYHQTWAYQQDSNHKGFANYRQSQPEMYDAIIATTKKINRIKDFSFVVPAGTAIQNARTSSQGDTYTRDGYHLQLDYGRFTAACTWFEKIFNEDVRKNPYKPENITQLQSDIAKESAHKAVKKPWKTSTINL